MKYIWADGKWAENEIKFCILLVNAPTAPSSVLWRSLMYFSSLKVKSHVPNQTNTTTEW